MADPSISPTDRDIAIRTMIGEEGSPEGQAGVASVMLNRAKTGQYGGTSLSDVAFAPSQFESWARQGAQLRALSPSDPQYQQAGQIFDGVASGSIPDLTNGATHFYAPTAQHALAKVDGRPVDPAWAKNPTAGLGQTMFYAPNGPVSGSPAAPPAKANAPDAVSKYLKPVNNDPANDPVLGKYLKPLPSAAPAPSPAAASVVPASADPAQDAVLSKYLKPLPGQEAADNAPPGSFPLGDPRNKGLLPFSYSNAESPPAAGNDAASSSWRPSQNAVAGKVGDYLLDRLEAAGSATKQNFLGSADLAHSGEADLAAGNFAPSFPSADPSTWTGGGVLKTLAGYTGAAMSPLSGVIQAGVEQPVTDLTGSPEIGQRAGFVANSLAAPALMRGAAAAPGAIANKLVGSLSSEDAALADAARTKYGIPLTADQMSASPAVKFAGSTVARLPFSGAASSAGDIQNAFTRAVSNTFGEDTNKITPNVMQSAKARLGNEFDTVAANTTTRVDPQFVSDIHSTLNDARSVLPTQEQQPLINQVQKIYDVIDPQTGAISGDSYQALTRKGAPLDNLMSSNNPNTRFYAGQLRDALDGAMQRSATPDMANRLSTARSQYKAMKTVEDLVEKSPTGDISPAGLMTPVRSSYGNMAYNGGGDLGNLARIGQRFLKEPPSSGTSERLANQNLLAKAGSAGAAILGLHEAGVSAPAAALSAAASIPTSILAGRAVGSTLRSPWLANNMLNRSLRRFGPPPSPASYTIPAVMGAVGSPAFRNEFTNSP